MDKEGFSQFQYYDSLTYSQYVNEKWKDLIKSSGKAKKEKLDYYYLRMRRGIAYYNRGNYLLAERNFLRALDHNNIDPAAKEYVYYSKLWAGKEKEASRFYFKNESFLEKNIDLNKKIVSNLSTVFVYKTRLQSDYSELFESEEIRNFDGSQLLTMNMKIASFLLSHDINKYFRLFHGGTYLNKTSYLHLQSGGNVYNGNINNISQYQYYAGLGLYPGSDFLIFSGIHFIQYKFPSVSIGGRGMGSSISLEEKQHNAYSARISGYKYISIFRLGGGLSLSNLNKKNQFQWDSHVTFYPLGNRNLYFTSSVYNINEEKKGEEKKYLSFHNSFGIKSLEKLWVEATIKTGESRNLVTQDGFNVFNSDEIESLAYGLSMIIPGLKRSFRIMFNYSEYYNYYYDAFLNETDLNKINSNSLSIIGELKWNF